MHAAHMADMVFPYPKAVPALPLKPLPELEGPKLDPFTQDVTAHDLEFLAIPKIEWAGHSLLARVKIDGQEYCLKRVHRTSRSTLPP